jgi:hypothetical protein
VSSTFRRFAADQLPGGRKTRGEVETRCGPAALASFPDLPLSNNISEGILGMTKAALRKSRDADPRSVIGKTMWRVNNTSESLEDMPHDLMEKLLQFATQEARSMGCTNEHCREMAALKDEHFQAQQAEGRRKEEDRSARTNALQAMQPAQSKEEVDAIMQQTGAAQILNKHLKSLLAQEDKKLS